MLVAGSYGADGAEYRTETESYTRIVSYGSAGNGPAWFKAWTKSGQIMDYGNTADSRIEAQGKPTVRVWAVDKISDTKSTLSPRRIQKTIPTEGFYARSQAPAWECGL